MASSPLEGTIRQEVVSEAHYEKWAHWPINWSAVWVGTLASIAALLIFGLIGIAIGCICWSRSIVLLI